MRRAMLLTGAAMAVAFAVLTTRPHAQSFSAPAGAVPAPDPNVPSYFEAETRELDIYALTMARPGGKPGPKLIPARGGCSPEELAARRGAPPPSQGGPPPVVCGMQQGPGRIRFGNYPLSLFANGISARVGRAVVDRTGLAGNWEFELEFQPEVLPGQLPPGAPPPPVDPDAPNLFTAIQEQLGLKLEPTKGPVEVWVIDGVDHPMPD